VLLALTGAGMARDQAYRVVQACALSALDDGGSFRQRLEADPDVARSLKPDTLAGCFHIEPFLAHVDALFARAQEPSP
jgi:adenylosuccinate lyase